MLIQKTMKIELLLEQSKKLQVSQEALGEAMKVSIETLRDSPCEENLAPLFSQLRPRCPDGHLMHQAATGPARSIKCCSCGSPSRRAPKTCYCMLLPPWESGRSRGALPDMPKEP